MQAPTGDALRQAFLRLLLSRASSAGTLLSGNVGSWASLFGKLKILQYYSYTSVAFNQSITDASITCLLSYSSFESRSKVT
jgi:hypothetical protein